MAQSSKDDYTHFYKIGDQEVGKTNFLNRFLEKGVKMPIYVPTVALEFTYYQTEYQVEKESTEDIEKHKIKCQIWDTAGVDKFRAITVAHYRRVIGAVIVYDITNLKTYENVPNWIDEVRTNSDCDVYFLLIGNKRDLETKRAVYVNDVKNFANREENSILKFGETISKPSGEDKDKKEEENIKKLMEQFLIEIHKKQLKSIRLKDGPPLLRRESQMKGNINSNTCCSCGESCLIF